MQSRPGQPVALSHLAPEQAASLDKIVAIGQRAARLIRPGRVRDALHGVWLVRPVHPLIVQAAAGTWLSASIVDFASGDEIATRRLTAIGLAISAPAVVAGAADCSEQREQQMRVGVVHALANTVAAALYVCSLLARASRTSRALRLGGLGALTAGGVLGGHLSFRLAGGATTRGRAAPHQAGLAPPHPGRGPPGDEPVRVMLGEVPVVVIRPAAGCSPRGPVQSHVRTAV